MTDIRTWFESLDLSQCAEVFEESDITVAAPRAVPEFAIVGAFVAHWRMSGP